MRSFHTHFLLCTVSKYHKFFLAKKTKTGREKKEKKRCSVEQSAQIGERKKGEKNYRPKSSRRLLKF